MAPRVLIPGAEIQKKVCELGRQISRDYAGETPVAVCVMMGAMIFAADLLRCMDVPTILDTMELASYHGGTASSGTVTLRKAPTLSVRGRKVLLIEDIVDTGRTLAFAREMLRTMGAREVKACALLSKLSRREVEVELDYVGFEIADHFVVGYGLDYEGMYRQLPYIGVVST